eukprot:Em0001g2107a
MDWLKDWTDNLDTCISKIRAARQAKQPLSLGYHGNIVLLWQHQDFMVLRQLDPKSDLVTGKKKLHDPQVLAYLYYCAQCLRACRGFYMKPACIQITFYDDIDF